MFSGGMPNLEQPSVLVESATKCLATADSGAPALRNQALAEWALVMVSWVVKVLEATMKSVVSACTLRRVSAMCVPSTLLTKWTVMSRLEKGLSASVTMTGPRSEPPIPMFTTSVIFFPVWPFQSPECTRPTKASILASTSLTPGITSLPSTRIGVLARLRSATWSTARPSVLFIFSPENMRFAQSATPASAASSRRSFIVSSSTMFLEKSTMIFSKERENLSKRAPSAANMSRILACFIFES
mmetsp:Transcript_13495/g.39841  ORF Transcript_13495/g.39841 Transcript_13495/m.39841 type:complete len:243 (-) Transcript_13495:104-832(-)